MRRFEQLGEMRPQQRRDQYLYLYESGGVAAEAAIECRVAVLTLVPCLDDQPLFWPAIVGYVMVDTSLPLWLRGGGAILAPWKGSPYLRRPAYNRRDQMVGLDGVSLRVAAAAKMDRVAGFDQSINPLQTLKTACSPRGEQHALL